jgi:predicted transposase/invertase (TIGR01784 family)
LEVKVININEGKNEGIAKRCRTLAQYSAFIGKVREYEEGGILQEEAVEKAVKYCRSHDILNKFLKENASEVINMLITEWNWDIAKEVWQEEAREEGFEEGILTTARNALEEGLSVETVQKITGLSLETINQLT